MAFGGNESSNTTNLFMFEKKRSFVNPFVTESPQPLRLGVQRSVLKPTEKNFRCKKFSAPLDREAAAASVAKRRSVLQCSVAYCSTPSRVRSVVTPHTGSAALTVAAAVNATGYELCPGARSQLRSAAECNGVA